MDSTGYTADETAESESGAHRRPFPPTAEYLAEGPGGHLAAPATVAPAGLVEHIPPGPERRAKQRLPSNSVPSTDDVSLDCLLDVVRARHASDLHLTANAHPTIRLDGSLVAIDAYPVMTPTALQRMIYAILTQKQREKFEENLELDFAYAVPGRGRFRVNVYRQRDSVGATFRLIPGDIRKLEELDVPASVAAFAALPRGFVLVTGPTGSGKSTTLAALIDMANRTRREHIMTVEDPIEFLHTHQASLVNQREVGGTRTPSPTPSSMCCGRTRTSFWSVRCVTWRRSASR